MPASAAKSNASDRSIRVLRVITRLNIGGPAIQAITLSQRLTERGFPTRLVYGRLGEREGDMAYLLPEEIEVTYLPSLRRPIAPVHDGLALLALYRLLRQTRPAIVHTHTAKAGSLARIAAAIYNRTIGRKAPACIVHTYHGHVLDGYFGPRTERVVTWAERRLARLTDAIVAISPQIRSELLDQYGIGRPDQYRVIPLGFDLGPLAVIDDAARHVARKTLAISADAHIVSTVGRLTAIKQHWLFLETAQRIASRDPAARFLVVGDGELRTQLEERAQALGLAHQVRFLGWRTDLPTIYAATDVLLLTSRNEGTPVALIESLSSATPAVSTDVGGIRDVIGDSEAGVMASAANPETLAARVNELLADPSRRRAMGARGRAAMLARYGIDRLIDDIERLYRELLA
jgi:glycosyltransferase involved in cell wall biosynthesis